MVTTVLPATAETGVVQERSALPLMCTVQAPHRPAPQPYFVPVSPTWSRMAHSSGVFRVGRRNSFKGVIIFYVNKVEISKTGLGGQRQAEVQQAVLRNVQEEKRPRTTS